MRATVFALHAAASDPATSACHTRSLTAMRFSASRGRVGDQSAGVVPRGRRRDGCSDYADHGGSAYACRAGFDKARARADQRAGADVAKALDLNCA